MHVQPIIVDNLLDRKGVGEQQFCAWHDWLFLYFARVLGIDFLRLVKSTNIVCDFFGEKVIWLKPSP